MRAECTVEFAKAPGDGVAAGQTGAMGVEPVGENRVPVPFDDRLAARGAAAAQDRESALLPKKPILLAADDTKKAEAEARKAQKAYEALLRTVDRGLDAMELKGAKGGARELEEALAAIDQQYEQLYEKIEQLNESDRKAAVARADAAKELIKANTRIIDLLSKRIDLLEQKL